MATKESRYAELNKVVKGPQIIEGLRERILCAINLYMRIIDYAVKELDTREYEREKSDGTKETFRGDWHTSPGVVFYKHWGHYEQILSAGIYCLGLVKSKVKNFEDMSTWKLPHYYDGAAPTADCTLITPEGYAVFKALPNPINPAVHFKHQRTPVQKIVGWTNVNLNSSDVAWAMIYSLSTYGIEINAGHKMASVGQILTLMSLFSERFKSCWYQDAGVNMTKNVAKTERGDETKFRRFNTYGLNRNYYHHFRMLNYPKEIKARLRRMTGVGTDIIDYINVVKKGGEDPFREKEQIQGAMKRKLAFWNHNNNVFDYLKYVQANVGNDSALAQINATFIGVINARMPAIQYNIVLPAVFWFFLHDHKIFADFSSQSAYRGYQKLRELMDTHKITMITKNPMPEVRYAILMSIFDLHQVDQNIVPFMFKIAPKTRADFSPKFTKGNTFYKIGSMPELVRWSKMYNGERGGGGEEQCSVTQAHAGYSSYQGDDMIVTKPDDVTFVETQQGGLQILQRLQSELNDQYKKKHKKVVTYGTQKWYDAIHVTKTNKELETTPGIVFVSKKIQPFYVAAKGVKGMWKKGAYTGQIKRPAPADEEESGNDSDDFMDADD